MAKYLYQFTSGMKLFPRAGDRLAFLIARLWRQVRFLPLPGGIRERAFHVPDMDLPVVLRPHTTDFQVAREMFLKREYQNLLVPMPTSVGLVLDCGSNIGLSIRLWQKSFPEARIVAVEPDADNARLCQKNIDLGSRPQRVKLVRGGVSSATGELWLKRRSTVGHQVVNTPGEADLKIAVYCVPDLLGDVDRDAPVDLMKCDIEGAEESLFADCRSWIGRVKRLLIETHGAYTLERLEDDLRRNGVEPRRVSVDLRDPTHPLAYYELTPRGGA
jgi:FkbM family methyltransferase